MTLQIGRHFRHFRGSRSFFEIVRNRRRDLPDVPHIDDLEGFPVWPPMQRQLEDAVAQRAILLADVNTLIAYGLLSAEVTAELLGTNGYRNVITDLGTLASVLRTNAATIARRTTVEPEELTAAENLGTKLGKVVGEKQVSPQVIARVTRNRQAAYTLFIKAYEEVRSAVQYFRHREGDADSIMPSLFAGRGGRKKATDDAGDKPNAPNPSPTPVVNPPAPSTSGNNGAPVAKATDNHGPFV